MYIKKILTFIGIVLALFSLVSLNLPIYSTYIAESEGCDMVIKGFNLIEFSPWGGIVLLTPAVLIFFMLSKLKPEVKTVGVFGLLLLDGAALCGASSAAYSWITDIATGFVKTSMGHLTYAVLLIPAMVCLWMSYNVLPD